MDMQFFLGFIMLSLLLVLMAVHHAWQFEQQMQERPSLVRFWLLALVNLVRVLTWQDPLSFKMAYPSLARN